MLGGRSSKPPRPLRSRKDKAQLRKVFDAWREYTVRKATGHTGRKWQNNEGRELLGFIFFPWHRSSRLYCPLDAKLSVQLTI